MKENRNLVKETREGVRRDKKKLQSFLIEISLPELLNVGCNARKSVDTVDNAVLLDEFGTAFQHHWNCKK